MLQLIKIAKTVYDPPDSADGKRILVMRFWPRGISKERVDVWMKDLGIPKKVIRKWKAGEISWEKFAKEYERGLKGKEELLRTLVQQV